MTHELAGLVEEIWRGGSKADDARKMGQCLTEAVRAQLQTTLRELEARAFARRTTSFRDAPRSKADDSAKNGLPSDEAARLLLLLTLGVYHSDSLVYLPKELRDARLDEWTRLTNFPLDLVKEAVSLGPSGLGSLLQTA